jgi:hypothetical protein
MTDSGGGVEQSSVGLGYPGCRGHLRYVDLRELAAGTEAVMAARGDVAGWVPAWIEPMLATPDGGWLADGPAWAYE